MINDNTEFMPIRIPDQQNNADSCQHYYYVRDKYRYDEAYKFITELRKM